MIRPSKQRTPRNQLRCAEKFQNNFPTSIHFFFFYLSLRCILMPRLLSVFLPCFTSWRKQKSYPQINLETSKRYVCRTAALLSLLSLSARGVTFNPPDIAAKFWWNGHLQDISIVSGIQLPSRCRGKVFSGLRRGRFLSRCPPVKWLFGVWASRGTTLHSALTSYRCGSL